MSIDIISVEGANIAQWLDQLAELRIRIFRDFPYLYDGTMDYERNYLETYVNSNDSIAVLALDQGQVIGASTGLPLSDEEPDFQAPFQRAGYDLDKIFYCAESVLLPAYRGQGIYKHFFEQREVKAQGIGHIRWMTFCAVERAEDHPLRPKNFQPLNAVWQRFGYSPAPGLKTSFTWKDIDEASPSPKIMAFYLKLLWALSKQTKGTK